jgi:sterol desaturase/sphingolipid hydroxylase (fatty acid hydroxylase superfamily)
MLAEINAVYVMLVAALCVLYPGEDGWFVVPLFVLIMGSALYWVHRLGHTLLLPIWFEAHVVGHHIQQYPSKRFSDSAYRINSLDKYQLNTWMYAAAAILVLIGFHRCVTRPSLAFLTLLTALLLYVEDTLHTYIHTLSAEQASSRGQFMSYIWHMHRGHHIGSMKTNYAVLSLWLDWLYGSLSPP